MNEKDISAIFRQVNATLAKLRKKDVITLLMSGNGAFSEAKLARKTRDQIVETYGAEIRRLILAKMGSDLGSSLPK